MLDPWDCMDCLDPILHDLKKSPVYSVSFPPKDPKYLHRADISDRKVDAQYKQQRLQQHFNFYIWVLALSTRSGLMEHRNPYPKC